MLGEARPISEILGNAHALMQDAYNTYAVDVYAVDDDVGANKVC